MSFLHNLYSKVIPDSGSRRTNSFDNHKDKSETPVFEDYESEDGFVVYSEKTTASNRQTYGVQERLQYNTLQTNAVPGNYNPPGYSPSCSSITTLTSRGPKEHPSSTFLTVSDIPVKLSKSLELIHNSNKGLSFHSPRPIDIGDYLYDFGLERTVINSNELGNTGEKRS